MALSMFRLLWMIGVLIISTAPSLILRALGFKENSIPANLALSWFIVSSLFVGTWGTYAIQFWKIRHVNPRFRIIALRAFHHEPASILFRDLVAPVLGCYGDLIVVKDDSYLRTRKKVDGRIPDFQQLGDPALAMQFSDEEWRERIVGIILESDLAVIDLTMPTMNILWETSRCLMFLPPHRIFMIGSKGIPWNDVMKLAGEYYEESRKSFAELFPQMPPLVLATPIPYGGLFGMTRFRIQIFRRMRRLAQLDNELKATGAWQPLSKNH
jgi:hypothetical protein